MTAAASMAGLDEALGLDEVMGLAGVVIGVDEEVEEEIVIKERS